MAEKEEEGVFKKAKRFKGALQSAVDRKMQEVADYGFQKGQELESKGYPRLGAAAANAGAGAAALGSTVAKEGMDYIPESGADAAMIAMGPAGRLAKQGGRMLKIADKAGDAGKAAGKAADAGETVAKNNAVWTRVKSKSEEAAEVKAGLSKLSDLSGPAVQANMQKLRDELRKQGKNEMEVENTMRRINNAAQYNKK
jgi:hypothetical protein